MQAGIWSQEGRRGGGGRREEEEDVVLNSGLVTDKTLLFPTSQHDHGDKPGSDWLCCSPGAQHLTPASPLPLSSLGISTAALDPDITLQFTLLPRNISL